MTGESGGSALSAISLGGGRYGYLGDMSNQDAGSRANVNGAMASGNGAAVPTDGAAKPANETATPGDGGVPSSRVSHAWVAIAAGIVALIVVIVFILENLHSVRVTFFGATWKAPLAVDLLLAAVLGGLVVFLLGTVRIVQLRRVARRRGRENSTAHRQSARPASNQAA